jgi:hypothetical protein
MLRRVDTLLEALDAGAAGRTRLLALDCGLAMGRRGIGHGDDRIQEERQQNEAGEPGEGGSAFHDLILSMRWAPGRPKPARIEAAIR